MKLKLKLKKFKEEDEDSDSDSILFELLIKRKHLQLAKDREDTMKIGIREYGLN